MGLCKAVVEQTWLKSCVQRAPRLGGRNFDSRFTMTLSSGIWVVAGVTMRFLGEDWSGNQIRDRHSPLPLFPRGSTSRQGIGLDCRALGITWETGYRNGEGGSKTMEWPTASGSLSSIRPWETSEADWSALRCLCSLSCVLVAFISTSVHSLCPLCTNDRVVHLRTQTSESLSVSPSCPH